MEIERIKEDIDNLQDRVQLLEQQSILIARMDENIIFIKNQLESGSDKFVRIDDRVDDLEKKVSRHDQFIEEHPAMCKDLEELKLDFGNYKSVNQGKWVGASTLAVVGVGVVNIILMIFTLYALYKRFGG